MDHRMRTACYHNIIFAMPNQHHRLTDSLCTRRARGKAASRFAPCPGHQSDMPCRHIRFLLQLYHRAEVFKRDIGPFGAVHFFFFFIPCVDQRLEEVFVIDRPFSGAEIYPHPPSVDSIVRVLRFYFYTCLPAGLCRRPDYER